MGLFPKKVNGYVIKQGANLSGANLINANLSGADLIGVNLDGEMQSTGDFDISRFTRCCLGSPVQ